MGSKWVTHGPNDGSGRCRVPNSPSLPDVFEISQDIKVLVNGYYLAFTAIP